MNVISCVIPSRVDGGGVMVQALTRLEVRNLMAPTGIGGLD